MSSFTTITKEEFEEFLTKNYYGKWSTFNGGIHCQEYTYAIKSHVKGVRVRIYSSIDKRTDESRSVGADAIRFVLWNYFEDRPISKTVRVNRVGDVWPRISSRIEALSKKASVADVVDYEYVKHVLAHATNSGSEFAISLLEQVLKRRSLSKNQLNCVLGRGSGRNTMEQRILQRDPKFLEDYFQQEDTELEEEIQKEEEVVERRQKIMENPLLIEDPQDEDTIQIYSTEGYPYSYPTFNRLQCRIFPYIERDCNVVISANTSSGKTICAELLMFNVLGNGRKVIYLSPLKALTQEKYEEWTKLFPQYKIVIMTGDYQMTPALSKKVSEADIILMTSEMLDSRTRMIEAEKNFWFYEVGLLIVDEVHILGQVGERGHPMEVGIMRFTKINPTCRVSFLSATMANVSELGLWLSVLNEKETIVIKSSWRPVELKKYFVPYDEVRYGGGFMNYKATQNKKIATAIKLINAKPDQKFLVFCHDKNAGRLLLKNFSANSKEDIRFHNADLKLEERHEIESSFKNGLLRVLVSTPTLAWGCNLPARNVISVGVHRGLTEIDDLDLIQMAGRAGRPQYDPEGNVYVVVPRQDARKWENVIENPKDIISNLKRIEALAFHILGAVYVGDIYKAEDSFAWYKRSLAYLQNTEFTKTDLEEVLQSLIDREMLIQSKDDKLILTGLGKVSVFFYFSPYDVHAWYSNFQKLVDLGPAGFGDDHLIAWAMASIPTNNPGFSRKDIVDGNLAAWGVILKDRGLSLADCSVPLDNVLPSVIAFYNCISGAEDIKNSLIAAIGRSIRSDIGRSANAVTLIDSMFARWSRKNPSLEDVFTVLELRVKYGVGYELLDLVRIPNIGAKRAKKLYENGFNNIQDLKKCTMHDLIRLLGDKIAAKIKAYVDKN